MREAPPEQQNTEKQITELFKKFYPDKYLKLSKTEYMGVESLSQTLSALRDDIKQNAGKIPVTWNQTSIPSEINGDEAKLLVCKEIIDGTPILELKPFKTPQDYLNALGIEKTSKEKEEERIEDEEITSEQKRVDIAVARDKKLREIRHERMGKVLQEETTETIPEPSIKKPYTGFFSYTSRQERKTHFGK